MFFSPGPSCCGKIEGVVFRFDGDWGFVLSYEDLYEMYKLAKGVRKRRWWRK